jgi:hypothetical protein
MSLLTKVASIPTLYSNMIPLTTSPPPDVIEIPPLLQDNTAHHVRSDVSDTQSPSHNRAHLSLSPSTEHQRQQVNDLSLQGPSPNRSSPPSTNTAPEQLSNRDIDSAVGPIPSEVQNEADLSPTNQRDKKRIEELAEARATEEGESQDEGGERQEGQEEDAENNNDDNDEENDEEPVEIDGAMDTTKPVRQVKEKDIKCPTKGKEMK